MTLTGDGWTPLSQEQALQRMLELEASRKGMYVWGGGHYDPEHPELLGMTTVKGLTGWDCAGAAVAHAFALYRTRPGFNEQPQATVSGDLNVDSVIQDASPNLGGRLELGELVTIPAPGVLILTPTIRIPERNFFEPGHVRMCLDATRWNPAAPKWADVTWLECHGPQRHTPGVTRTSGESLDRWDETWPTHKAAMVRIRARPA